MKKFVMYGLTLAVLSSATVSYADIFMSSFSANACPDLSGSWIGTGKVSHWMIGDCSYRGSGNINRVDERGDFMLDLHINKSSGSILCPQTVETTLPGKCGDGQITLKTKYGHLTGHVAGNTGSATGQLSVAGVSADVTVTIKRV